jgi:hypothetical protein
VSGLREVLYSDTDGLAVTPLGYSRLVAAGMIRDNEPGELRLVAGPVEIEVLGTRCIRIGDEIRQAGAPVGQRDGSGADPGFWFRRPFDGGGEAWRNGYFQEEYREYQERRA